MSNWKRRVATLAAAALLAIPASTIGAVDLEGTTWDLSGPERLVVRRLGRDRGTTAVTTTFNRDGTFGLDQDGNEFSGTYSTRGRRATRLRVTLDSDSISTVQTWLADWIEDEASDRGHATDVSVSVTGHRIAGTINRAGTRATVLVRFVFVATDDDGRRARGVYRARLRGNQTRSITAR